MKRSLREWQKAFLNGEFKNNDFKTQVDAGWYDWFCRNTILHTKTEKIGKIIAQIKDGGKVDLDKTYVFFENNCPVYGDLYDVFKICDLKERKVLINVDINCLYSKTINGCKYAVYGIDNEKEEHFNKPMKTFKTSRELVKWLNTPWEEK